VPPFTVILVDDLSRLSRDVVETLKLYRRLQRAGVELVAVADGIQTTHQMAKLQITIKGLVNELYLDDLRDKTHRGMTGRALKGLSTGGWLFGYRTTRGAQGAEWVVFEPEAEIVRRIFREYAGGLSMKALVVRLNAEGVSFPAKVTRLGPTRRGWAVSTIHTILMNEKYLEHWAWNKAKFVKDPETGKRTSMRRPRTIGWSRIGPISRSSAAISGRGFRSGSRSSAPRTAPPGRSSGHAGRRLSCTPWSPLKDQPITRACVPGPPGRVHEHLPISRVWWDSGYPSIATTDPARR
jgi:site-specific DNA recombinase